MKMVRTAAQALFGAAAMIAVSISGAQAQSKDAAPPPPVGAEPQTTSATYGDWILRCALTGAGAQAVRACEVELPFQLQGQQAPFAQLAIGRISAKDPLHLTFIMSPNVAFPSSVKLSVDEKDAQPIDLTWSTCIPAVCRADAEFKDDQLKRWKALTSNGVLRFKDSTGKDIPIPVSIRGLAQALEALPKS